MKNQEYGNPWYNMTNEFTCNANVIYAQFIKVYLQSVPSRIPLFKLLPDNVRMMKNIESIKVVLAEF